MKRWTSLRGYLVSVFVHGIVMLILLHWYLPIPFRAIQELIFQPGLLENSDGEIGVFGESSAAAPGEPGIAASVVQDAASSSNPLSLSQSDAVLSFSPQFSQTTPWASAGSAIGLGHAGSFGDPRNTAFGGRGDGKGFLLAQGGGTEGSEKAVALGLEWLAEHQNPNGSWSYDFTKCPKCRGKCSHPSKHTSVNSATALAILPFLGCGITPKTGDARYRPVVEKGLKFLLQNGKRRPEGCPDGLSFIDSLPGEGPMYHHGIAAIAVCEAASMTQDPALKEAARQAVHFICYAQIPTDGGWRYEPRDRSGGDTSVFGWQIMALKSGQMGGVPVPPEVFFKAQRFLDSVVGIDKGAMYGYRSSSDLHADNRGRSSIGYVRSTTPIGLLCQMYMGWPVDHPALIQGVEAIAAKGPDRNNLYYDYYATQVIHHYGGETWKRWNLAQRDPLIARQSLEGHERGSWYFDGQWNDEGGRLYTTSLAVMILEVYYRHLPLYQKQAAESEFPLD